LKIVNKLIKHMLSFVNEIDEMLFD